MIANLTRGGSFRGLLKYLFQKAKNAVVLGGNMAGLTLAELAAEFDAAREANTRVKTPVWHCSLSLPPGERRTPQEWNQMGASLLAKLGLDKDRPWLLVAHNDTDHQHAHLVTSRVDYSGEVWYGHWAINNLLRAKAEVEKEFGLQITPINIDAPKPSRGKLWQMVRKADAGEEIAVTSKTDLIRAIDDALGQCAGDLGKFSEILARVGVEVKLNQSKTTGRVAGASFRAAGGGDWFKGSQLGKDYTWKKISEQIVASTPQPTSITHETERITSEHSLAGDPEQRNQSTAAGVKSLPRSVATGGKRADQPGTDDPLGPGANQSDQPLSFPSFAACRSFGTGRNPATTGGGPGRPDRIDASDDSRDPVIQQPAPGVGFLDVVKALFRAAMDALARLSPQPCRVLIELEAPRPPLPEVNQPRLSL